jgi:hypothetical protein
MTIVIHWWEVCIAFATLGIVLAAAASRKDPFDGLGHLLFAVVCWMLTLGICIGKLI